MSGEAGFGRPLTLDEALTPREELGEWAHDVDEAWKKARTSGEGARSGDLT